VDAILLAVDDTYKFGYLNPDDQPYGYQNVWATEKTTGPDRLVIAPASGQVDVMLRLMEAMPDPFWVLYVLVVPRGEGEPGRYQSPEPQGRKPVQHLLEEFKPFFEQDGRQNLWIASTEGPAMLIYDRHNVLYAYGTLDGFRAVLSEIGLKEVPSIRFPRPHTHHYNEEFDADAGRILEYWEWQHTPLRDADTE